MSEEGATSLRARACANEEFDFSIVLSKSLNVRSSFHFEWISALNNLCCFLLHVGITGKVLGTPLLQCRLLVLFDHKFKKRRCLISESGVDDFVAIHRQKSWILVSTQIFTPRREDPTRIRNSSQLNDIAVIKGPSVV